MFDSILIEEAIDYLLKWTEEYSIFSEFSWVALRKFPDWSTINKTMRKLADLTTFDLEKNSSSVFQQYGFMKNYCTDDKLIEWKDKNLQTEERWVEVFSHMNREDVPFLEFSKIIEFALCFPGSSAPVERIFARTKKIWKQDSSSLQIESLSSILFVKINLEYECIDFYKFLKSQPELLKKIARQDKYSFKEPKPVQNSTGAMSVDENSFMSIS